LRNLFSPKKYQNEIKELRNALQNDKKNYDTLLEEKARFEVEIRTLQETIKSKPPVYVTNGNIKDSKPIINPDSKQEKVIMEALSHRLQALEKDNLKLQQSLKAFEIKCVSLEKILHNKTTIINAFLTECCDKLPMAAEYVEKVEKDDVDFIKNFQKFGLDEIQILAEKTFMENLRLKKDLTMLGSELNKVIRSAKK